MDPITASALSQPRFKANPYPFYARMRAESPVFPLSIPIAGRGWAVTRYQDVVTVAKDDRFSRDVESMLDRMPMARLLPKFVHVTLSRQMLSQDPPDHTRLRKLVSQAFTPERSSSTAGPHPDGLRRAAGGRGAGAVLRSRARLRLAHPGDRHRRATRDPQGGPESLPRAGCARPPGYRSLGNPRHPDGAALPMATRAVLSEAVRGTPRPPRGRPGVGSGPGRGHRRPPR